MSIVWKLEIDDVKLFTKLSKVKAQCNVCNPVKLYAMANGSTKSLILHIPKHPEYKKLYDKLKTEEEKETQKLQKSMKTFLDTPKC